MIPAPALLGIKPNRINITNPAKTKNIKNGLSLGQLAYVIAISHVHIVG